MNTAYGSMPCKTGGSLRSTTPAGELPTWVPLSGLSSSANDRKLTCRRRVESQGFVDGRNVLMRRGGMRSVGKAGFGRRSRGRNPASWRVLLFCHKFPKSPDLPAKRDLSFSESGSDGTLFPRTGCLVSPRNMDFLPRPLERLEEWIGNCYSKTGTSSWWL